MVRNYTLQKLYFKAYYERNKDKIAEKNKERIILRRKLFLSEKRRLVELKYTKKGGCIV